MRNISWGWQLTPMENEESVEFWLSCSAVLTVFLTQCSVRNGGCGGALVTRVKWGTELKAGPSSPEGKAWLTRKCMRLKGWQTWVQIHRLALHCVNFSKFLKPSPHLSNMHNTLHTELNEVINVIYLEESLTQSRWWLPLLFSLSRPVRKSRCIMRTR